MDFWSIYFILIREFAHNIGLHKLINKIFKTNDTADRFHKDDEKIGILELEDKIQEKVHKNELKGEDEKPKWHNIFKKNK